MSKNLNLADNLSDLVGPDAIELLGAPLRSGSTAASVSVIDPARVASGILQRQLNLDDREQTLKALESMFQSAPDGSVKLVTTSDLTARSIQRGGSAQYGFMKTAAVAMDALSRHAATSLGRMRPLSGFPAEGGRGHESTVGLIRSAIAELDEQFASGEPQVRQVNLALDFLCGGAKDETATLGGYECELKRRCGLEKQYAVSDEDDQIYSDFLTLESLTRCFLHEWKLALRSTDKFFGVTVRTLTTSFAVMSLALQRLRSSVSPIAQTSTEVGEPPMTGANLLRWMHTFAAETGPRMLAEGREEAMPAVNGAMTEFATLLPKLAPPEEADGCNAAFAEEPVRELIGEVLCEVKRIRDATIGGVQPCAPPVKPSKQKA